MADEKKVPAVPAVPSPVAKPPVTTVAAPVAPAAKSAVATPAAPVAVAVSPTPPASPTTAPAVPVPTTPPVPVFTLTSADKFLLKDTNNDGIPDLIVVEHVDPAKEAAKVAEAAKFSPYFKAISDARVAAAAANAGKSALEVAAAQNVAEAKAKADYKGPIPPEVTKAEQDKAAADKKAAEDKAAVDAEIAKLAAEAAAKPAVVIP